MADNEFAGSALYAQWIYSGGTVQINTEFRNWQFTDQGDVIDATAGGDVYRRNLRSYDNCQVTASFLLQSTGGTVARDAFKRFTAGTLIWGEAGTATGMVKTTMPAYVESASRSVPYNDVAAMDVTFTQNGALAHGAY
jgi:hypothetical protein